MTPNEIHDLETELLKVAWWQIGAASGEAATLEQTAHVAIALAGTCARLLSMLPASVASEIRAHLVVTEASLRASDAEVLELLTEHTEDAKVGSDPTAESCLSPTVQTENGDSGPASAGHAAVRGATIKRGSGASVDAEGVACHDQATPLDSPWLGPSSARRNEGS